MENQAPRYEVICIATVGININAATTVIIKNPRRGTADASAESERMPVYKNIADKKIEIFVRVIANKLSPIGRAVIIETIT
jgi:hypothetical protein